MHSSRCVIFNIVSVNMKRQRIVLLVISLWAAASKASSQVHSEMSIPSSDDEMHELIQDSNKSESGLAIIQSNDKGAQISPPEEVIQTCSVCLENLKSIKPITTTFCNHQFHTDCLNKWLNDYLKNTCPLCRNFILERPGGRLIRSNRMALSPNMREFFEILSSIESLVDEDDDYDDLNYPESIMQSLGMLIGILGIMTIVALIGSGESIMDATIMTISFVGFLYLFMNGLSEALKLVRF
jgi:hypothetical protein